MIHETRKVVHSENLLVAATSVRVPVLIGHTEAVHIEFAHPMSPDEARRILSEAPGIKVQDDPTVSLYPQPWSVAGTDEVFVGRIRKDSSCENGLIMWLACDNLRKGAALNAVQIAE
jgi:aspartate-semialdehyde dehydrogenase